MSCIILDCTKLPCPQPVIRCRDILQDKNPFCLHVIVDNLPAKENVFRFLTSHNYTVEIEEKKDFFTLMAKKESSTNASPSVNSSQQEADLSHVSSDADNANNKTLADNSNDEKIVVFLSSLYIGEGDKILGEKLLTNFIKTLPELGTSLHSVILVNEAVKLATSTESLHDLQALEKYGTKILVCGTCLQHFNIFEQKQIGETTNMLDIMSLFQLATKIIRM